MSGRLDATATAVLLAHQGGWDEVAMIAVPIMVIAALLAIAKRRVDALAGHPDERQSPSEAHHSPSEAHHSAGDE